MEQMKRTALANIPDPDDAFDSAIVALHTAHREIVEGYARQISALVDENGKLRAELAELKRKLS